MYLEKILKHRRETEAQRRPRELAELERRAQQAPPARDFRAALQRAPFPAIIAEFKRASPSKGVFRQTMDPAERARAYERGGAAAMSVLTEPHFFKGYFEDLQAAKEACSLPILRKDFLLEEWELWESRVLGADAVLLIAAALTGEKFAHLYRSARRLGLHVLVEVHDPAELEQVLPVEPEVLGVNNRNLHTFEVDLEQTRRVAERLPESVTLVSESGFSSASQIWSLKDRVEAFLIGETLVISGDPETTLKELRYEET